MAFSTALSSSPFAGAAPQAARSWLPQLRAAFRALQTRRELAQLDDRMLRDLGLSRADAWAEAGRAPWDLAPR